MDTIQQSLYLDLMKKTLSFTLWDEPSIPIETFSYRKSLPKRVFIRALSHILRFFDLQVVRHSNYKDRQRTNGMIWPLYADTMIELKQLDNI